MYSVYDSSRDPRMVIPEVMARTVFDSIIGEWKIAKLKGGETERRFKVKESAQFVFDKLGGFTICFIEGDLIIKG